MGNSPNQAPYNTDNLEIFPRKLLYLEDISGNK